MFVIKCDVHPWMQSYMGVFSHPFFAVTGGDGKFTIANLPAGTSESRPGTRSSARRSRR